MPPLRGAKPFGLTTAGGSKKGARSAMAGLARSVTGSKCLSRLLLEIAIAFAVFGDATEFGLLLKDSGARPKAVSCGPQRVSVNPPTRNRRYQGRQKSPIASAICVYDY